jgi:hypothetical protein
MNWHVHESLLNGFMELYASLHNYVNMHVADKDDIATRRESLYNPRSRTIIIESVVQCSLNY